MFLEQFPNLQYLTLYAASDTDLTPVETKTSLISLSMYIDGDDTLDVSQLTGLHGLHFGVPREGALRLETSAELSQPRVLDLFGGWPVTLYWDLWSRLQHWNLSISK